MSDHRTPLAPAAPTIEVVVSDAEDEGARADVVLGRRAHALSRRVARQRALAGALTIDGRRAPPSARVHLGARLCLRLHATASQPAPDVSVLLVTDDFIYVDKPPGVHTQRLRPDDPSTLSDAVAHVHPECADAGEGLHEGGAVHRLDRGTSGVVCFARNRQAWLAARDAFGGGTVAKTYIAAVTTPLPAALPLLSAGSVRRPSGAPPALDGIFGGRIDSRGMCIDAPLGPGSGPAGSRSVTLSDRGRDAITEVWPVTPNEDTPGIAGWAVVSLRTGHRHQARVHLAAVGSPIIGDPLYGPALAPTPGDADASPPQDALLLHAAALQLGSALPNEPRVVAPLAARFFAASAAKP